MTATATTRSAFHVRPDEYRADFLSDRGFVPWSRSLSPKPKAKLSRSLSIGSPTSSNRGTSRSELKKSKSVHFADSKGLALVSVQTFNTEKEIRDGLKKFRVTDSRHGQLTTAGKCRTKTGTDSTTAKSTQTLIASPKKLVKKVKTQKVCLEKTELLESGVQGTICVLNVAFEKTVVVRYTLDKWLHTEDVPGIFHSHSREQNVDRFVFEFPIPTDATTKTFKVEFAVCYKVSGDSFWDNNNGFNYHILFARE